MAIFHVCFKKIKMNIVLIIVLIYIIIGLIFAVFFVSKGATKIDDSAKNINWKLKLMLLPASIAFWPILLKKML